MAASRRDRLKKLVAVQEQLKALHETRHAGFVANAIAAEAEAQSLSDSFDSTEGISQLFPELYHRRIKEAIDKKQLNLGLANVEVGKIATATARTNMVERAYREVRRQDERDSADRERLEIIERKSAEDK
ncbi:hypothetical protein N7E70_010165 [Aminobacter sp. NyZ550]|jgi:hypothetical protein|uniref:Uncharacterized protein n=2 Tax=Aminobacter TaxID=31988 RepID=A0AAC8YMD6_AMIAI|nr:MULTISPECIES: hypothetical protein [Aminobacter]AMS41002.1 hypothetical protein AA2016_2072 [Aminobacter aminovorans]MBA8909507.1 hypothetical protein [Aminobacter ciceronei]MBA9023278.1 hypothetical protein [Aminobacter ciceronei]MBB3706020.1 hypothetical protein [Aminobacter aminovorans]MRX35730.1 hypothetical protein [Aminobacter sp. MDW-2]